MSNSKIYKNTEKNSDRKGGALFQWITSIYVIIILGLFPLVYNNYYFDILIFKYRFYCFITVSYIIIMAATVIIFQLKTPSFKIKDLITQSKFSFPEVSMVVFLAVAIISTLQSDYKYESLWGNEGRFTGCFLLLLYGTSILLICRTFKLKAWFIDLFLFTGILVCLFGITDYFKMDIMNFKKEIDPNQYNMFVSTIGNVNTYTSYVALITGIATVMFAKEKSLWRAAIYYIVMVISFFAIIMGLSDNSYLALGTLFALLPLYLFKCLSGIKRYIVILTTFSCVIYVMDIINRTMPDKILKMEGILTKLSGFNKLEFIVAGMVLLTALVYFYSYLRKSKNDKETHTWQRAWFAVLVTAAIILIFVLCDANLFGNSERYGGLGSYLVFNDDWGTHRGYNWRIGLENYGKLSFIHKLFGTGPDTYGILTYLNNYEEMAAQYNEIYDSAHNEYLQYFITMGPLSLISYLAFLISSGVHMIKMQKHNVSIMAILFAVISFAVQAFVNISVPIVAPIVFTLVAIGLAETHQKVNLLG